MGTMTISLPEAMQSFIDEQARRSGYKTTDAYVCALIRKEQDREELRGLIHQGLSSALTAPLGDSDFAALRQHTKQS